jgi:hypothetical protein
MADYPNAVYEPRTKENKTGVVYTPAKTTIGYAEDITKLDDEVVAIENELGTNPKGNFSDVKARLEALVSIIFLGMQQYGFDHGITHYFWATRYASDNETQLRSVMPVNGKLKNLYMRSGWNDCNGNAVITLYVNGSPTSLTLTIPSTGVATYSDTEHEVEVEAGDTVVMQIAVGGSSGAVGICGGSLIFKADVIE